MERVGLTVWTRLTFTRSHLECYMLFLLVHKGNKYNPSDLGLCRTPRRPYFQWISTNTSSTTLSRGYFGFFWQALNCTCILSGIRKAKMKFETSVSVWTPHSLKSRLPNPYKWKFNCEMGNELFSLFLYENY